MEISKMAFQNLHFRYDNNEAYLLEKATFDFPMNQVCFIRGTTGAGKSTLFKVMLGIVKVESGDYLINDLKVQDMSFDEFKWYRLQMGYAFDVGGLINNLNLVDNFQLPFEYHGIHDKKMIKDRIDFYFDRFNLNNLKHLRPSMISSGARKAAILAKAFLFHPQALYLNNPTLGLNQEHLGTLISLIQQHQKEFNLKHIFIISDDQELMKFFPGHAQIQLLQGKVSLSSSTSLKLVSNL
jgi:ABC-type transporter Mla maintaining outer membrane lipid asymmetry ATPase subunit MlaF